MRELDLTKKQTSEYLDHVEQTKGSRFALAGTAASNDRCPLALAYKYHHPKATVSFNGQFADVAGHSYEYRVWQKKLIDQVDRLGEETYATVDYVRSLLEWV